MEAGPITTPFSYAYVATRYHSEIDFLRIAGGQEEETTIARPHLLTPECQVETYAVPEQADAFQCLIPKARHCDEQFPTFFIPIRCAPHPHGEGMLCT